MKIELRVKNVELRANKDDSLTVSGYVNKTGQWSEILGVTKKFKEKIAKGAFSSAIRKAKNDIDFLAEHDSKKILASTRNGSLNLTEDEQGLFMSAVITPTSYGRDYYELIKSGIHRNMSFGFRTIKDSWKNIGSGLFERTIEELELFEVSVVKSPAYSQSTIAARGIDLVEEVEIPEDVSREKTKEKTNMKIEHRYVEVPKNEVEVRQEEVREFNEGLRDLNLTSGNESVLPTAVAEMIVEKLDESSPIFAKARKIRSVAGSIKIPRETAVGIGSFVGEGKELIEEAFSLGEVTLTQKRAGAYIALTNQLINDAAMNMAEYTSNLLVKRTFKAIERSILQGAQVDEFAGIVPNSEIGKQTLKVGASDQEALDTLMDMSLSIHPEYLQRSQFIMSRPFYNRIAKLKDAAGHFYVQNGFVNGKPTYTLFGLEVIITSSLDAGDVSHVPCIVGSIEDAYAVMIKQGGKMTKVQDSQHALQGSVGFLFDIYVDGAVYNPDALTKLEIIA
ncbi:phage major capsid protein [Fictibacillus nanhaiensis]|uniref:Phage major capsid protein n=1 Tax=Fictibacillus nanhaiensis TaxID=742169 RepID=A0ABS2ZKA0_9BACL|nr:phage major capsid protein [Fictibacillus nanhaiensis]